MAGTVTPFIGGPRCDWTRIACSAMLASVDGVVGPAEEALIPVTDEGLTRGDGAFEVMRLYDGVPFALEAHLGRMAHTCAGLRLELDEAAVRAELAALLAAAGPVSALVRVVLTRGGRRVMTIEDAAGPAGDGPGGDGDLRDRRACSTA